MFVMSFFGMGIGGAVANESMFAFLIVCLCLLGTYIGFSLCLWGGWEVWKNWTAASTIDGINKSKIKKNILRTLNTFFHNSYIQKHMATFRSNNPKDDKVMNLENDAQERTKRIEELQEQTFRLIYEEKTARAEYDAVNKRLTDLRKRNEELSRLKAEETALRKDIEQKEQTQSALIAELERIQEERRQLTSQITPLRSKVASEEAEAKKVREEAARLARILDDTEARKKKIQEDTEFEKRAEEELRMMEDGYKEIAERVPLMRKKYEETKQLVEELEKKINPINKSITDIWQKLPEDALDRLVLSQKPR